ncbi:hypothetical protein SLEP1_g57896 [Rubroshorea leprosula]|uniref:non-specific serine/threonine protein kinase n=1 Tax=Rubroshorea leprosula TaxID=152421 RepID=A0AAV5MNY0_9ROSI|nr:hypothetical protein SLEP1_g57896 [Rubroshorea leprosula]
MRFSMLFLFLISSAFHINLTSSAGIAADFQKSCDGSNIANSSYEANLNLLFSKLVDQDFNHGFYNVSVGQSPDQVNAIALCRGDKKEDICRSCLKDTTYALQQTCPNKTEAIGWSEFCTLRYSNRQIYGVMETDPFDRMWRNDSKSKPSDVYGFRGDLSFLLNDLSSRAANGDSLFKYAEGSRNVSVSPSRIHALAQCTPDLRPEYCSACLATASDRIGEFCLGDTGCRILQPSCFLRYEIDPFLDDLTNNTIVPLSPPSPSPTEARNENTKDILLFDRGKTSTSKVELREVPLFKFVELATSTNNFNIANLLGQGGFGPVYRGTLPNGQEIAIKRLSRASGQGVDEFKNEVLVISSLQHRNLVKLLGCCVEGEEKILVYEYMPNNSLDTYLFDLPKKELQWRKRFNIIEGISQDFGLARIFGDSEDQANTKRVVGT